jgi:hypothetical protein
MTYLEEIFNIQSENAIVCGEVSTAGRRIEIYLADSQNFLIGRLS